MPLLVERLGAPELPEEATAQLAGALHLVEQRVGCPD
jgi:hypothetical protein